MSTSVYLYKLTDEKREKKIIGIKTWEQRPCFTWVMHPVFFFELVKFGAPGCGVVDENGNLISIQDFLLWLKFTKVMRYDMEDAKLLE